MTDREAIKLTRMQTEALQAELAALETAGDIDAWKTAIEAKQLAVTALQEREERGKGCEWCGRFRSDPAFLEPGGNGQYVEVVYQYCPMCGKKLEDIT